MSDNDGSQVPILNDRTRPAKLLFCWTVLLFGILVWVILLTAELLEGRWDGLTSLLQFVKSGLFAPLLALFFFVVGVFATSIGRGASVLVTLAGIVLLTPVLLLAGRPTPNVVALPPGAVTMFLSRDPATMDGCPLGWVRAHELDSRFAYGAPPISTDPHVRDMLGNTGGQDSFPLEYPGTPYGMYLADGTRLPEAEVTFSNLLVRTDGSNRSRIASFVLPQQLNEAFDRVRTDIPTMPPYRGVLFCKQDIVVETPR